MKLLKISMALFAVAAITSCQGFLDTAPLDAISDTSFWNTERDMEMYNNKLYELASTCEQTGIMHGFGYKPGQTNSVWLSEQMSDNVASTHSNSVFYIDMRTGNATIPTSASSQLYGYRGWDFLRSLNYGIQNYSRAKLEADVYNMYAAEARLFRAWFYAVKVQRFGAVQWIDKPLDVNSPELYGKRDSRDVVMGHVLEDLDFAIENLPEDWKDGGAPGRLNKWCALLIKSRLCLFEGTFLKYHGLGGEDAWLKEAKEAAADLMENGPYELFMTADPVGNQDYARLHQQKDYTGNPEVMYWQRYTAGINSHNASGYFTEYSGGATRSMIDSYLCTDGKCIEETSTYSDDEIEDMFVNRDPRMRQSILHPDDNDHGDGTGVLYNKADGLTYPRLPGMSGTVTSNIVANTGFHIIKHYNYELVKGTSFGQETQAAIILRYAEALLNYAEAAAEIGGITQADIDKSINLLRKRAGMPNMDIANLPNDPQAAEDGVSALIYEIRRERRVEQFIEGFRYNDLMRWKLGSRLAEPTLGLKWDAVAKARFPEATEVKTTTIDGVDYIDVYKNSAWPAQSFNEKRDYLWPIPLDVLSKNPNLGQNPGWE